MRASRSARIRVTTYLRETWYVGARLSLLRTQRNRVLVVQTRPFRTAKAAASARVFSPSLLKMLLTCVVTVRLLM